jgi:[ribosomal protein S5]-alanine N-acetyltransferase
MKLPESERLYLRELTLADTEHIYRLHSDPEVMKYIRPPVTDIQACVETIQRIQEIYAQFPGLGVFAATEKAGGAFIGWFLIKHLDQTADIEIGYRLLPVYWGKGYATEMTQQLIQYGFRHLGLPKLTAVTHPDNLASQRVLQKCDLQYIRNDYFYDVPVKYFEIRAPHTHK